MIKELLAQQLQSISYFSEQLALQEAESLLQACLDCKGLIVFSGVGKSGLVAEKIAVTLISTGTRAIYLPPTNFLHGDLGILGKEDLFILLSRSGETEELLELLPFARAKGCKIASIVSKKDSRLSASVDLSVYLPLDKELCPFDLAPTTSTVLQLIFGEVLAVALMKKKNFTLSQYALNHPAGAIGKKMMLKVDDLMIKEEKSLPLCAPDQTLREVLVELTNKKCGCLLVVGEKRELAGIFTDGDLRRALQTQGSALLESKISCLMTPAPVVASKEQLAWEALKLMQKDPKRWVMTLPVVEKEQVVGLLRLHDLVHAGF